MVENSNIPKEFITTNKPVYPTETIELPSKGIPYNKDNPLSSGTIELRYPTARDEDILTSKNLIQKGTVIDTFIKSLIVTPGVNADDLLLGDKNAIIIAARILAYGKDYPVQLTCSRCNEENEEIIDISQFESKEIDISPDGTFEINLPASKKTLKMKLLTQRDERLIDSELKGLKKYKKSSSIEVDSEVTTRLKYSILSINGDEDKKKISEFVSNELLAMDAKYLRDSINKNTPDIDIKINFECKSCNHVERVMMPLGINFFWPSSQD